VDSFWDSLTEGGEEGPCGWLKDRYGVSWQIVPTILSQLLSDSESGNAQRATEAMFQMKKIDIGMLQRAYRGE
jgi:predicted 3-demethylubiquinone-9 3-methyltransferase (glyoxalase superfamily)